MKIRLQIPLKIGPRRCLFRRWEAELRGRILITKTMNLERMYRGNTPYPIGATLIRKFPTKSLVRARLKMLKMKTLRIRAGYKCI